MFLQIALFLLLSVVSWAQCPPQDSWECNPPVDAAIIMNFDNGVVTDLSINHWRFIQVNGCCVQNTAIYYPPYQDAELHSENENLCGMSPTAPKTAAFWLYMDIPGNEDGGDKGGNFFMGEDWPQEMFSSFNYIRYGNGKIYPEVACSWWEAVGGIRDIVTGQWYHVVVQYEPENLRVYLDGEINATNYAAEYMINLVQTPVYFGVDWWGRNFYGKHDDIIFFDRILSKTEIMELYQRGKADGK